MKKFILSFLLVSFLAGGIVFSCKKITVDPNKKGLAPNLPASVYDYLHVTISGNFIPFNTAGTTREVGIKEILSFTPNANMEISNDGATLGRVLFYDKVLSINNSVSCGSCHKQNAAFADPVASSEGFGGKFTPRNSMTIINPFMNNNMFWDSRTPTVEQLTLQPVFNHLEMGMESMDKLVGKIAKTPYYPDLFAKAFGSQEVTPEKISSAMAQFLCSMVSANSKFDKGENDGFASFSAVEKHGKEIFFGNVAKCSQCHAGANFSAPDFPGGEYGMSFDGGMNDKKGAANIGLDKEYADNGRGEGLFRIPSLRNIALTAPFMHDGRFTSLDQVVEHYNSGVQNHKNLDKKLKGSNGMPQRLGLSEYDKMALVAFLKTLTDVGITTDKKYADPFAR
jgi:cytochrome c peroxidase